MASGTTFSSSSIGSGPTRFRSRWYNRIIPIIGIHRILITVIIIKVVFICIILGGCTSEGLNDVYLLSLSCKVVDPANASTNISAALASLVGNNTSLQVRVSFIGLCASLPSGDWSCSTNANGIASLVKYLAMGQNESSITYDPLNLVGIAKSIKDGIVFNGLLFIALPLDFISFLLLLTFPGWVREEDSEDSEVKPFPARPVARIAASCLFISALMVLLSVFWQHLASAGAATVAETLTAGAIKGHVGSVAMGLGWAAVAFSIIPFLTVVFLICSYLD